MTKALRHNSKLSAATSFARLLTAVALAFVSLSPSGHAQTSYTHTAETAKPTLKSGPMTAGGLKWECTKSLCTNIGPWQALGIEACRSLAQVVGPMKSFGRPGAQFSAAQLNDCNKVSIGILVPGAALSITRPSRPAQPLNTSCMRDDDCEDGAFCNGTEFCNTDRRCWRVAVDCDDHVACTMDRCNEERAECTHTGPDADSDGHADESCILADGLASGYDCDDGDGTRFPGAGEVCDADGHDEDCNLESVGNKDSDGDGHVDAYCSNSGPGGTYSGGDCDDANSNVHPRALELCNNTDDDCDGTIDDSAPKVTTWPDNDRDGFGDPDGAIVERCLIGEFRGWSLNDYDCDDANARRHPGTSCP